jgi:hypothetical protein
MRGGRVQSKIRIPAPPNALDGGCVGDTVGARPDAAGVSAVAGAAARVTPGAGAEADVGASVGADAGLTAHPAMSAEAKAAATQPMYCSRDLVMSRLTPDAGTLRHSVWCFTEPIANKTEYRCKYNGVRARRSKIAPNQNRHAATARFLRPNRRSTSALVLPMDVRVCGAPQTQAPPRRTVAAVPRHPTLSTCWPLR